MHNTNGSLLGCTKDRAKMGQYQTVKRTKQEEVTHYLAVKRIEQEWLKRDAIR